MKKSMVCSLIVMLMLIMALGVTAQADVTDIFVDAGSGPEIALEGISSVGLVSSDGMAKFAYGGVCTGYDPDNDSRVLYNPGNTRIRFNNVSDATGTYVLTIFDSDGDGTVDETVNVSSIQIDVGASRDGRYLVRDMCDGQWYASEVTSIAESGTSNVGVPVTVSTLSWFTVDESATINAATASPTGTFPGGGLGAGVQTLNFTASAVTPSNIDGGGVYYSTSGGSSMYGFTYTGAAGSCGGANAAPTVTPTADPTSVSVRTASATSAMTLGYADSEGDELDTTSITWSVVSGPGAATIDTSVSAENPTITLPVGAVGDYVINAQAAALTGETSLVNANVTITTVDNTAPNANIRSNSSNKTIYYDETLLMESSPIEDDSDPCAVTFLWEVTTDNAADIEFQDPCGVPDSTLAWPTVAYVGATPTADQVYTIQFTVYDNEAVGTTGPLSASESTNLTVIGNVGPTVEAGDDQYIFPVPATTLLAGVATDDGYPKPTAFATEWFVDAGPGSVIFTPDKYDPNATAEFNAEGVYTLRLQVSDGVIDANDLVTITVWPKEYAVAEFQPEDDTFVRSNRADNVHGASTDLRPRGTGWFAYLQFDVNGNISGQMKLATLKMKTKDDLPNNEFYPVTYGPSGDWDEGTGSGSATGDGLTWNTDDLVWGSKFYDLDPEAGQWYEIDVAADMVLESDGKATFGLKAPASDGNLDWNSKESTDSEPVLIVTYDPAQAWFQTPLDGAAEVHPSTHFTWNGIDNPVGTHDITIDDNSDFSSPLESGTGIAGVDPNTWYYDATTVGGLPLETEIFWKVTVDGADSEVLSYTTMAVHPDFPISISPVDAATDLIAPYETSLVFTPGDSAASNNVYIGSSQVLVDTLDSSTKITGITILADPCGVDLPYDPTVAKDLLPMTTYYWRAEAEGIGGPWANATQSFTTGHYTIIEDFETATESGQAEILGVTVAGGAVGTVLRDSDASVEVAAGATASLTFDRARHWDDTQADTLVVYVTGTATDATVTIDDNTAASASVTLSSLGIAPRADIWQAVNITLDDLAGINLGAVKKLSITPAGGTLTIDDVRLYGPVDEAGLLGFRIYYPFDVDASDSSPAEDDATLVSQGTGTAAIGSDAAYGGGALALDSSDGMLNGGRAQAPDTSIGASTGLTISLWVKNDATSDNWPGFVIEGTDRDPNNNTSKQAWEISYKPASDQLRMTARPTSALWVNQDGTHGPDTLDGNWHHIVSTYDSAAGVRKAYVDGTLRVEMSVTPGTPLDNAIPMDDGSTMTSTDYGINIGSWKVVANEANKTIAQTTGDAMAMEYSNFFDGSIDEVVAYTRALTADEIDLIHRQGVIIDADIDGNGVINLVEFAELATGWGSTYDADDLAEIASMWLMGE